MVSVMSVPDAVGDLERRSGSLNRASRKADIPLGTLFAIKNGSDPRLTTLHRLAASLDMTFPAFAKKYIRATVARL